jgi:pimeloyl-ACP methyl ester carboxylesterase
MIDSRTVNVEGARVAYRMQGNGPPIVLVNGKAALDVHWGPVIPALAKQWTVISLDYSGSGETTDDGSALSLQKLANQVVGTAKAAGLDRFDLVGHSLGAAVAISYVEHGSPILPHVWVHRIQAARFKLHPWQTLLALCHQGIDELCRR